MDWRNLLSNRQGTIASLIAAVLIILIGILTFNYFSKGSGQPTQTVETGETIGGEQIPCSGGHGRVCKRSSTCIDKARGKASPMGWVELSIERVTGSSPARGAKILTQHLRSQNANVRERDGREVYGEPVEPSPARGAKFRKENW